MSWLKKLLGERQPKKVTLQPSGATFEVGANETILERALKEGIAYPHDCTVGTCGSCRSRLIEGSVDAITPFGYTLSREELEQNYILACQALPRGDVTVEIDVAEREMPAPRGSTARIVAIADLTHDIRKVTWEAETPIDYVAGQYMNIAWPGSPGHRSYSFCEAPAPGGRQKLSAFVRRVPGGAFSELLFGGDAQTQPFEIDCPHGNFWLRDSEAPMLCIAGGSGLSPLISLLEDAADRGVARDVALLFGGRAERDLYCADEIAAIGRRWKGRFAYWPALSETPAEGVRAGFVTAHVPEALAWLGGAAQAYMCGPPPMIDAAMHALAEQGIPIGSIFYDKFTDASTAGA